MSKNTLFIITGLPYAGKTTLRNALTKRFDFAAISVDDVNKEYGIGEKEEEITQNDWNFSYSTAFERVQLFLKEGKSVVFDGNTLLVREREVLRHIAKSTGARSKLIYVQTPVEIIKERRQNNLTTQEREHVPDDLFQKAFAMWEEPTPEENPILFTQTMNVEQWIQENITKD